jgi:hypothetical protein
LNFIRFVPLTHGGRSVQSRSVTSSVQAGSGRVRLLARSQKASSRTKKLTARNAEQKERVRYAVAPRHDGQFILGDFALAVKQK